MKTTLVDCPSLYPNFSPYIGKYGDNGLARTKGELKTYFDYYKLNSADYWKDTLSIHTESMIRKIMPSESAIFNVAKKLRDRLT